MQRQRQAGFIRNYSQKTITPQFQQEPSEFSYFRPRPPRGEEDEFSPYKIQDRDEGRERAEIREGVHPPVPLRPQGRIREPVERVPSRHLQEQGEQIHARLKQQAATYEERQSRSKEKLQENIGNIRNKIEQLDFALQELKNSKSTEKLKLQAKVQREIQAEMESSSSQESEEVVVNSIPSPKISIERVNHRRESNVQLQETLQPHQSRQLTIRQSNQRSNSYSQRENIVTFNSRTSNQPPLQIRDYSSSDEEEQPSHQQPEQSNYLSQKHKEPPMRPTERQQPPPPVVRQARGVYKNKGGVCFDIDTKQFTEPIPQPKEEYRPAKKPVKVDKRSQVLRRRETAKAYDRMARKALFTGYN